MTNKDFLCKPGAPQRRGNLQDDRKFLLQLRKVENPLTASKRVQPILKNMQRCS